MAIAIMVPSDSLASQVRPTVCPIPDKREGYDCSRATHGNQTIIQRTFLDITEPEMAMARSRTMRRIKKNLIKSWKIPTTTPGPYDKARGAEPNS
jgi:hypothetical protein